jgi:hypothetical protein
MGLFDHVFDEKVPSNLKCPLCGLAFEQCTRTTCNQWVTNGLCNFFFDQSDDASAASFATNVFPNSLRKPASAPLARADAQKIA